MKNLNFFNLLYTLLMALLIGMVGMPFFGPEAFLFSGLIVLYACMPVQLQPNGTLRNEVVRRLFSAEVQRQLYPPNEFYKNSILDAGVAADAVSVEIPQSGLPPTVLMNPAQRPIPLRLTNDDRLIYYVDLFETEPDLVLNLSKMVDSYDKQGNKLYNHIMALNTRIATEMALRWFPTISANIITTSGTGNTGTIVAGMAGTRKEITNVDLIKVCTLFDTMNVPDDGRRNILFYTEQMNEVKAIPQQINFLNSGIVGQFQTGAVGKIQNMNVYKRSIPLMCTNATPAVVLPYGSAAGGTTNLAALAWHPDFVRRAEGVADVNAPGFTIPGYGGPTMNAFVRGGGTPSRLDEVGVIALVQGQ